MARYPDAIWTPANPHNEGGPIGKIRLVVDHIEEGSEVGTNSWFQNIRAQVSAHFGISKTGQVFQFVDTNTIAWAEQDYNDVAISIEHEGMSGDPFTPAQISSEVKLGVWIHKTHGVPIARTTDPLGSGWITHGELGVAGGNHPNCPGTTATKQLPLIVSSIKAAVNPQPTPSPSADELSASGLIFLHNPAQAKEAIKNGWALYVWTGFKFAVKGTATATSDAEYANYDYQQPHHPSSSPEA